MENVTKETRRLMRVAGEKLGDQAGASDRDYTDAMLELEQYVRDHDLGIFGVLNAAAWLASELLSELVEAREDVMRPGMRWERTCD